MENAEHEENNTTNHVNNPMVEKIFIFQVLLSITKSRVSKMMYCLNFGLGTSTKQTNSFLNFRHKHIFSTHNNRQGSDLHETRNHKRTIYSLLIGKISLIRGFTKRFCLPIGQISVNLTPGWVCNTLLKYSAIPLL